MKNIILLYLLAIIVVFCNSIFAQDISFQVTNLLAGPAEGNWMFETDDPNTITHDGNPYTSGAAVQYNNFAYKFFTWDEDLTQPNNDNKISAGLAIAENLAVQDGIALVTLKLYDFSLKSFHHINTVNSNNPWNTTGEAGDERVYAGGIGEIYVNGVLKLKVINCRLSVQVPYPTEAQMDALIGGNAFTNNVGTGLATTGSGWGVIDAANSDNGWAAELDPNGTGQLKFALSTINSVIQDQYGYYDFDITVLPTTFQEIMNFENILPLGKNIMGTSALSDSDVSFNFTSSTYGDGNLGSVFTNKIYTNPGGSNPTGIDLIYPEYYWQIGTTYKTFTCDATFDITDLPGVTNTENLRIIKRNNSNADWAIYNDFTLVSATQIKANNLTSFSEFAIASVGGNALPVELISFDALILNEKVKLTWETATEVNNYGFEILRSVKNENSQYADEWEKLGFVQGSGNSNSPKSYEFIDESPLTDSTEYKLKQIDTDGNFAFYSKTVKVVFGVTDANNNKSTDELPKEFLLAQNYPNPFNPSTKIKYSVPVMDANFTNVKLIIYDVLGKEVLDLVNEQQTAGNYEIEFNASNLSSGMYFYKLSSNNFSAIKKMLLVK